MELLRVESYRAGVLVHVHVAPNWNAAKVYGRAEVVKGLHVLVMFPRCESGPWS
jgi:hypothetical protein